MAQTAKTPPSRLMLTPKALDKALAQSAQQAHKLAAAFGMAVPGIKSKSPVKANEAENSGVSFQLSRDPTPGFLS
jgi:hypothetical protein